MVHRVLPLLLPLLLVCGCGGDTAERSTEAPEEVTDTQPMAGAPTGEAVEEPPELSPAPTTPKPGAPLPEEPAATGVPEERPAPTPPTAGQPRMDPPAPAPVTPTPAAPSKASPSSPEPPDRVVLEATNGNVTLSHGAHAERIECATCHGGSIGPIELSRDTGHKLCLDCHKTQAKGPTTCTGCHKKA